MMIELEQRCDDLSKKLLNLSLLRARRLNDHIDKMNRPKLSYLFMSMDDIVEHEEKLEAKFDREEAALQAAEDKLYEELADIERQLNPAG